MNSPITLLVLAALLSAPAVADTSPALVTVSGQATVRAEPDRAVVRLGVETQRDSAEGAQRETNRIAHAIFSALEALGVPSSAIQTSGLSLQPVYSQRPRSQEAYIPEVVGYRADNTVQVSLVDLERVGPAIDRAIAAGANRVLGLSFSLSDDSAIKRQAVQAAVSRATGKAEAIAEALDRQLGAVVEVHEGGVSVRPVIATRMRAEMAADSGAPIAPGEISVLASVTIVYQLAD